MLLTARIASPSDVAKVVPEALTSLTVGHEVVTDGSPIALNKGQGRIDSWETGLDYKNQTERNSLKNLSGASGGFLDLHEFLPFRLSADRGQFGHLPDQLPALVPIHPSKAPIFVCGPS
ncbi:hypothetical protein AVEN_259940-1 [Araneus ventricosus]|uniref:Uncharacterized protein n=1 Tax=Araneus ventricosus TaxID=182803 RepID=A0A4Y2GQE8_ARAVE|nr:hypothetical protein AVEN_259940-1 [Araneus ventricosus]